MHTETIHFWHRDVTQDLQCRVILPMGAVSGVPPGEMAQCVAVTYCLFYNSTQLRQNPILSIQGIRHNHHNLCDLRKEVYKPQKHGGSSPNAEPLCCNSSPPEYLPGPTALLFGLLSNSGSWASMLLWGISLVSRVEKPVLDLIVFLEPEDCCWCFTHVRLDK